MSINPVTARDLVISRTAARAVHYPDLPLDGLDTTGLDHRDAGLARAIDLAVSRRWLTLQTVISHCLDRRWDSVQTQLQATLLVAGAQLFFLDRVPEHAVVNEAVRWAKNNVRSKAGGLVNAVLRRLVQLRHRTVETFSPERRDELPLADGRAWRLSEEVFDAQQARCLAGQTSHPESLVARWMTLFGYEETARLCLHNIIHSPIIIADPPPQHPRCEPHRESGFAVFNGTRPELEDLLATHRQTRVQDPASAAALLLTQLLQPKLIIDVCAGLGTKTRQLAAIHGQAKIVASDVDPAKRERLRQASIDLERVTVVSPGDLGDYLGAADLVVLDVPCSNTAVLARRPEAKYRFDRRRLSQLIDCQRQIVADSLTLLAPGAHLLYATCSLEPEENEQQIDWMTRWHPLASLAQRRVIPSGAPGDPAHAYCDGGFACLLSSAFRPPS